MLTIAIHNRRGLISEALADPSDATQEAGWRVSCSICGAVETFLRTQITDNPCDFFDRYTTYKREHRKLHAGPIDTFGTEPLF